MSHRKQNPKAHTSRSHSHEAAAQGTDTTAKRTLPESGDPVALLLNKVKHLLDAERTQEAFDAVKSHAGSDPRLKNAYGVCLLRLGEPARAVSTFRELALQSGGICLRPDVPLLFKTNYATALILAGNIAGGVSILREVRQPDDPGVQKIEAALHCWRDQMTFLQRILWKLLESLPPFPVEFDFPPGEID